MTTVQDVSIWLDRFAPLKIAESWDNVGLLWGDTDSRVTRLMTCLTVTPDSASEAIEEKAELIVSHHPVLFRPVKKIAANDQENGMLWMLAKAGISIFSPHTAFDNTRGGINDGLAHRLGLLDVLPLRPFAPVGAFKVVVFTPESDRESVLSAAFTAGAGRIGAYEECSFATSGTGTFFGTDGSNPTVGQSGRREGVNELRIECICPSSRLSAVLGAIRSAHSYEEPAIDLYPLHPLPNPESGGAGRIGTLAEATNLGAFSARVRDALAAKGVHVVGRPDKPVSRVAIVCGAGDDFLPDAVSAGADVLLTGEARFHRGLEAESLDVGLIVAGHHSTERPGVEDLAVRIATEFPGLTVWPSRREHDPFRPI